MRVLQVLPALESGGVERGTLEIAQALVAKGHESWVASAGGRMVSTLEAEGSHHATWDLGKKSLTTLLQVRPFRRWLEQQRFDIVHVRSRLPAWMALLALRAMPSARRPHFITTVHGLNSVSRYSQVLMRGERVIAVSETCRRYILDNYPSTDPDRLVVIPRGIDPSYWTPDYRPSPDWLAAWYRQFPGLRDRFIVTLPGRLTRLKGHEEFLTLMARLKSEIPELAGLIVGGAASGKEGYERELKERVGAMGLEDTVHFAGHRSDIRDIYGVSRVVMSLSTKPESFGRTVLEPLSMAVPVVGYNRGGVGEILESLFPAGAVHAGDLEAAAEAVKAVWRGQTPPVRENRQFLLKTMQEKTLQLYEDILSS